MKKICFLLFVLSMFIFSCESENRVLEFIHEYISVVSEEHANFKINITEKMKDYYMDYEHKEKAEMPEYLEIGPFRNNILVINNYKILEVKKITDIHIKDCKSLYSVDVQFTIESDNGGIRNKKANYWVVLYKGRYYIYGDNFLQDIYILEKDIK
ncbi:MAG: hypothetical protein IJL70_04435 [Treponema sp.]|nr:hypothetical protein [Treponema sp.]